jgi:hypothetical protein
MRDARMGILDIFRKKETYVLKRQRESGGMAKIADVAANEAPLEEFTKTELYASLKRGAYVMHAYRKGKSGFRVVWGPLALGKSEAEEVAKARARVRKLSTEEIMQEALAPLQQMQEIAKVYDEHFGVPAFLRNVASAKARFNELDAVFSGKPAAKDEAMYEGKLPIWMHPKAIVGTIDAAMNTVEKHLRRMGIVSSEEEKAEEILKLPDKPPHMETTNPRVPGRPPDRSNAQDTQVAAKEPATSVVKEKQDRERGDDRGEEGLRESSTRSYSVTWSTTRPTR